MYAKMVRRKKTSSRSRPRRGTVLVAAMWVVLILAALVLVFARTMRVELIASANRLAAEQASAIKRGAEQYVLSPVEGTTGAPKTIVEAAAEAMPVGEMPVANGDRKPLGYFWIIRPEPGNEPEPIELVVEGYDAPPVPVEGPIFLIARREGAAN
jgi:hypothetical protein